MLLVDIDVALPMHTRHGGCVQDFVNATYFLPTLLSQSTHALDDVPNILSIQMSPNQFINTIRDMYRPWLMCMLLADIYRTMCAGYERCWQDMPNVGKPMSACYGRH